MTETLNAYQLARLAECAEPDTDESPGAVWLLRVGRATEDVAEYDDRDEGLHETADALVPVYTSERWAIFTDLAAWNEDVTEYGTYTDMTEAAGVALYMIARRLLEALTATEEEEDEEELPPLEDATTWIAGEDSTVEVRVADIPTRELRELADEAGAAGDQDGWRLYWAEIERRRNERN